MGAKRHVPIVSYPGALGEPHVRIRPASSLFSLLGGGGKSEEEREKEAQEANLDALWKKLLLLADHYGAMANGEIDWKQLSIVLAFAHVPGFTTVEVTPRKRGRPGRKFFDFDLYAAVLDVLDEGEPSVANACRILCKRPGPWKGKNPATLETRFHEERRRAAKMDLRPHMPVQGAALSANPLIAALMNLPPRPSDKYPPVPFKGGGGLFALGASALYDHKKA